MFEELSTRRNTVPAKLPEYGFERKHGRYQYRTGVLTMNSRCAYRVIGSEGDVEHRLDGKGRQ